MKAWHGSYTKIDGIDLSKCRRNRDFGQGFYVTKFLHHAESWVVNVSRKYKTKGCVTEFEYRETAFTCDVCKIKHFEDYSEEWLDFVVLNRDENNPEPAHDYDIVEGPVADDKVQNRIGNYLRGEISKSDFLDELKYHEQTHQICFCTMRSLQMLKLAHSETECGYRIVKIGEPLLERLMLDRDMDEVAAADAFYSSQTFARLADAGTGLYRQPWREIYEMLQAELKM